jgi:hypothetical protein
MNKAILPSWLSALCVILVAVLVVNQAQQGRRLEALAKQQTASAQAAEQQNMMLQTANANLASQLKLTATNLETRLAQTEQAARQERDDSFRDMGKRLDDLLESGALFPDKSKPAAEAVVLAKAAQAAGNLPLAKIYYLSAVNHAPSQFPVLQDYAALILQDPATTVEDVARLKSVLQVSLYQIPPASIAGALALLTAAIGKEDALIAAQTPKPVPVDWQKRFDEIVQTSKLADSWSDSKALASRWERLNEIIESLREEQPDSALLKQVEAETEQTQQVAEAAKLCQALDVIMKALESSSEQPEKAVSLLQTAEGTLGQLWGIEPSRLPPALLAKISQYPNAIQDRVEQVAEVKARPFLAKVEAERSSAKEYVANKMWTVSSGTGGPNQKVVEYCNGCFVRASASAERISSTEGLTKAREAINEIRELVVEAKRKQFDAYQHWGVVLCKATFAKYDDAWFAADITSFSNTKGRNFFAESGFATVDQSLLTPETGRLFNDVLSKLTAKMNGDGQFQTQKEIAETAKKKLEDF